MVKENGQHRWQSPIGRWEDLTRGETEVTHKAKLEEETDTVSAAAHNHGMKLLNEEMCRKNDSWVAVGH